jgi:hypothetical protein
MMLCAAVTYIRDMTREEVLRKAEDLIRSRRLRVLRLEMIQHTKRETADAPWCVEAWTPGRYSGEMFCSITHGRRPEVVPKGDHAGWWSVIFSKTDLGALFVVIDESGEVISVADVHNWSS